MMVMVNVNDDDDDGGDDDGGAVLWRCGQRRVSVNVPIVVSVAMEMWPKKKFFYSRYARFVAVCLAVCV